jgi:Prokaryotic homologs of the JAB domain
MLKNDYRYGVLLFRKDGSALGSASVKVDWDPAVEYTRFYHARRGAVALCAQGTASLEPLWDRAEGEPHIRAVRVAYDGGGPKPVTSDFPSSYFKAAAAEASAEFVKQGKLEAGDTYLFQVVAFAKNGTGNERAGLDLEVVEETPDVRFVESRLDDFRGRCSPAGVVDTDDMPVFIPQRVLDEAAALTRAEQGRETGGILIGRLHHDPALPEIFAEVSAQIPAEHTQGTLAKLSFTAETWSAAEAALRLRNRAEVYLGYWHSHPVREWCSARQCTPERQKTCQLAKDFFSEDDRAVMRAAFPRAHSLGLVVNDTAFADLSFSLFGWRDGKIHPRGFYILEETYA